MSDLITITHLSGLVQDQARILDHCSSGVPDFDPIFPERNEHQLEIDDETWSLSVGRRDLHFIHRASGRSLLLPVDHPSPFAFTVPGLLRYVQSLETDDRITDLVVENWVLANYRLGRLIDLAGYPGHYTFAN